MKDNKTIYRHLMSLRSRYGISIIIFVVFVCALNIAQFFFMDSFFGYTTKKELIKAGTEIQQLDIKNESFFKDISNLEAKYNIFVEIYHPKDSLIYTTNSNNWIYESSASQNNELKPRIMKILSHKEISETQYFETRQEFYADAKYIVYGMSDSDHTIEIYYSVDVIDANSKTASIILFIISII
ncbi:MAG: hypothetical protein ACI4GY_08775, partial [Acutalibacteraceae bacterium]